MTEIRPQRLSPDLKRKVDANRASRMVQENAMKAQIKAQVSLKIPPCLPVFICTLSLPQLTDPDSEKPVWADPPPRSR
jgi:hypothetical protein